MSDDAIRARWNGDAFEPVGNYGRAWCLDNLEPGETVSLEVGRSRSDVSHRHQFAEIREAWASLPETMQNLPYAQNPEALRKHGLIVRGYCDVGTVDAGSKAAAERVAAMLEPIARRAHGYALVKTQGPLVRVYTPQSQSYRAMGRKVFQESKTAVLDWISARIAEEYREAS